MRWTTHKFIFLVLLLCSSCAQVGRITGGPKDVTAPTILLNEVTPPIGSISTYPKEIRIPFNEYIALNKPNKNIRVSPSGVKLSHKIRGKSLILEVEEGEWRDSTTYSIHLNHAVKDITEANDSIMTYVFSTGDFIDSLRAAIKVEDAYTGKPVKDIIVGLYPNPLKNDTSRVIPRYLGITGKDGVAEFYYLKKANYYAYAFKDENRNSALDHSEMRGVLREEVALTSDTVLDSLPVIRLMPPEPADSLMIKSNQVLPLAMWCMSFNRPINNKKNIHFFDPHPLQEIWNKKGDSVTVFYSYKSSSGSYRMMVNGDTISKRYFFKEEPGIAVATNLLNNTLLIDDTLSLQINDLLKEIDSSKIMLQHIPEGDSIKKETPYTILKQTPNSFRLIFSRKGEDQLFLNVLPGAIIGGNKKLSDTISLTFTVQHVEDVGNLILELSQIPKSGILMITNKGTNSTLQFPLNPAEKKTIEVNHLQPGDYQYRFLFDDNGDKQWTTGSIFNNTEAEKVYWFSHKTKIRANWDTKVQLIFKQK